MRDSTQITLRLSKRQLQRLAKLSRKLDLDRSQVIRLAIARLVEEEAARRPVRDTPG